MSEDQLTLDWKSRAHTDVSRHFICSTELVFFSSISLMKWGRECGFYRWRCEQRLVRWACTCVFA